MGCGMSNLQTRKLEEKLLREIVPRGCADVSSRLSEMLHFPIDASGLVVGPIPIAEVPLLAGDPESSVLAARVILTGRVSGNMVFMLTSASWDACQGELLAGLSAAGIGLSAFAELANIACSAFITHLSDKVGLPISFAPPDVMDDMAATVLEEALIQFSEARELFAVEMTLSSEKIQMKGYLFFMLSEEGVQFLLQQRKK